jgi:redox-sensing transcriptional repressor
LADRLRGYLRVLSEYERGDVRVVSSHQLARGIGIRATLVRRDLAELGGLGTPGRGYEVGPVTRAIREALDLERERRTIWLGVRAAVDWPLAIDALQAVNCSLVGVFDDDAQGDVINRLVVQPLGRAAGEARRTGAIVAVIASERAAQPEILEGLADAGVRGMLNLTPLRLDLTSRVVIEQCDLGNQLLRLVSRLGGD